MPLLFSVATCKESHTAQSVTVQTGAAQTQISANGAQHNHNAQAGTVTAGTISLSTTSAMETHVAQNLSLVSGTITVAGANGTQGQTVQSPALSIAVAQLNASNISQLQQAAAGSLISGYGTSAVSALQAHTSSLPGLVATYQLAPATTAHTQNATSGLLNVNAALLCATGRQTQSAMAPALLLSSLVLRSDMVAQGHRCASIFVLPASSNGGRISAAPGSILLQPASSESTRIIVTQRETFAERPVALRNDRTTVVLHDQPLRVPVALN